MLTTEYSGEHFWTRDLGTALQFAREMSGLVQAGALTEIAALFREQRDDSDALALGYKNRLARFAAEDRALDRALDARKEKAA